VNRALLGFGAALGVGLLAGALYQFMGVPTPAPPWWALCGLLAIVGGETGVAAVLERLRRRHRPRTAQPTTAKGSSPA
jgi:XapX domain-containing protein